MLFAWITRVSCKSKQGDAILLTRNHEISDKFNVYSFYFGREKSSNLHLLLQMESEVESLTMELT